MSENGENNRRYADKHMVQTILEAAAIGFFGALCGGYMTTQLNTNEIDHLKEGQSRINTTLEKMIPLSERVTVIEYQITNLNDRVNTVEKHRMGKAVIQKGNF